MAEFQKGQNVIVTLPSGKEIKGVYLNSFGQAGHSFCVDEFIGIGRNGEPIYKTHTYCYTGTSIKPYENVSLKKASEKQYKAWLERAVCLKKRVNYSETLLANMSDSPDKERETKKLIRYGGKLKEIEKKIKEYEKH